MRANDADEIWRVVFAFLLALQFCFAVPSTMSADENDAFEKIVLPAFETHCGKCHGATEDIEGDVNLLGLKRDQLPENIELIRQIIDSIDLKEMPPADEPELAPETRQELILELQTILHDLVARKTSYSPIPIRRMNRFQYNNAVIDLFQLKCIVFTLPERMLREHQGYFKPASGKMADVVTVGSRPLGKSQMIEKRLAGVAAFPQDLRAEHGFDNRADHLSLSPLLMESFLKLGQSVTQSPDFIPRNVGIWKEFFAAPAKTDDQAAAIRGRLKRFLSRAFRRPVENELLDRYTNFVNRQIESGAEFHEAMKAVAAATISSPNFLYLYDRSNMEQEEAGSAAKASTVENSTVKNFAVIDDFEFASRLSFFLWSSLPDQELLDIAAKGELRNPKVLDQQFNRMLRHKKLKRFCDSFPSQWLQLERIISSLPDREKFPQFYFGKYLQSMHMMVEPLLIFETVLIENMPITQLIDSDFTYRSGLLEKAYQDLRTKNNKAKKKGGDVTVLFFHRVPVTDRRIGGVITNAAVMTMTSGPERTNPITRGAWVASVIFNNPPEPPPADVPPLDEKPPESEVHLTLRERLSMHRKRADCRGCHERIDPLGFALENYDSVGRWREKYENDRDVDMQGILFRRHEFTDVVGFKDAILAEKDRFTRGLAGHVLSYAIARELSATDQPALDQIAAATAKDGYKIQTLLKQVILSEPFQSKNNPKLNSESERKQAEN
ncbi:MAG: DUF1592 domain-containing protein [Mariniblastus sp.]